MTPRTWLWIGVILLLIGISNAITGSTYGIGYMAGSLLVGLAVIYFGWYRRRDR